MQKGQKVTKNTLFKIFLAWLPMLLLSELWLIGGAEVTFSSGLVGMVLSTLAGYMTWQLVKIDELHRKQDDMTRVVREARVVICETCPFKILAKTAILMQGGCKNEGLEEVREGQQKLPLPAPSQLPALTSKARPPAASPR